MTRKADADKARQPLETEDRDHIINLSRQSIDIVIEAIKQGNSQFFLDMLVGKEEILSPKVQVAYNQYAALVEEIDETGRAKLTRDELFIILRWCVDNVPEAPYKFAQMLRHHGLQLKPIWTGTTSVRGFDVGEWK